MKRIVLSMAILAIFATTATAQLANVKSQQVFTPEKFDKLIIDGNINVVLKEGEPSVMVTGYIRFVKSVNISQRNNTLRIRGCFNATGVDSTINTVVIQVKDLKNILVLGDAKIISENTLQSPELKIFMNAVAQVNITNNGRVRIDTGESYELVR